MTRFRFSWMRDRTGSALQSREVTQSNLSPGACLGQQTPNTTPKMKRISKAGIREETEAHPYTHDLPKFELATTI